MTTYTAIDGDGYVLSRGLSLVEAADAIMTSDSCEWGIREDKDGNFTAWSRQQVANRPWAAIGIHSSIADCAAAEQEICEKIINSGRWSGHCTVMTDAAYDEMMAKVNTPTQEGDE